MKLSQVFYTLGLLVVFGLSTNLAMAQDYNFNPNVAIPDNDAGGLTDTQSVFDTGVITDVNVDLHITHTWQGDLIVNLTHDAVTVPLLFRAGDSDSSGAGFSADNFGTDANRFILDDEAAAAYDSTNGAGNGWGTEGDPGTADVSGAWIPYGEFAAGGMGGLVGFDGANINGDWSLFITDNAGQDTGSLVSWGLHFTTVAVPEPSSAFILLMGMGGLGLVRRRK